MNPLDTEPVDAARGGQRDGKRIVMLVDNMIVGDSRVQKQARSMSDLGWHVQLVGTRRRAVDPRHIRIGDVPAEMLYVPRRNGSAPHLERRTWLKAPLCYASASKASFADGMADAGMQQAELRLSLAAASRSRPRLVGARVLLAAARVRREFVDLRLERTRARRLRHELGKSPSTRAAIGFRTRVSGSRSWRRLDPGLWDWELEFGPVVDALEPDLIHANDHRMLLVAARAKIRAKARGRDIKVVWDVHEYIPGLKPWSADPRWHPAQIALEREYAGRADAVVTVSEELADLLVADHKLSRRPAVVLNAPLIGGPPAHDLPDVRRTCGLDEGTPLVVYSGGATPQRGLDVMVDALPDLPGVHTAFVVLRADHSRASEYVVSLMKRAAEIGVADRVHLLHYVPAEQVVPFLSTADVGVFPGLRYLNHSISLITKFLEYSHARLPIVVSDLRAMADTVRATGQGEVFEPGDAAGYARAVSRVLADPGRYARAYDDHSLLDSWTWQKQASVLDAVYRDTLGMGGSHT